MNAENLMLCGNTDPYVPKDVQNAHYRERNPTGIMYKTGTMKVLDQKRVISMGCPPRKKLFDFADTHYQNPKSHNDTDTCLVKVFYKA